MGEAEVSRGVRGRGRQEGISIFTSSSLEGVYLDRSEAGLKPRFVKGEPPSDADVAHVVQKISRRAIRTLHRLGYLEVIILTPRQPKGVFTRPSRLPAGRAQSHSNCRRR
jgi:hypothetical protein